MKRKTSTTPTRIWSFWCHNPRGDVDAFADQLKAARLYKNKLIEIEQARRKKRNEIQDADPRLVELDTRIAALTEQIEALHTKIKAKNQAERKRVKSDESRRSLVTLKAERKKIYEERKEIAATVRVEKQDLLKKVDTESYAAHKAAYNESTCFWGTKLLVDKELELANKTPEGPQFRRWDGRGRVGVQIQHGMPASALFSGEDTRIRITRGDPELPRTGKRALDSVMLRIGSEEKARPKWIKFPCIIHRLPPPDARVQWAWIRRYKVGLKTKYELSLVLEAASFGPSLEAMSRPERLCALDLGWRKKEGLRYAFIYDGEQHEEFALPQGLPDHFDKANSLRGIRDKLFNEARAKLVEWLTGSLTPKPEAFCALFPNLADWRSSERMERQIHAWKNIRFPGDETIFAIISEWGRRERHLHHWEAGARLATLNGRKDIYRKAARKLAMAYTTIIVEDFDVRPVTRVKNPDDKGLEMHKQARSQRFQVSVSSFRQELRSQCAKHGTRILEVPAENTTLTCNLCGHNAPWDKAPKIAHTCEGCGATWDQDDNAAINLYGRGLLELERERKGLEDGTVPASGRVTTGEEQAIAAKKTVKKDPSSDDL